MRKEKVTRAILASRPNSSPVHARAYMAKPAQQQPSSRRHTPCHDRPLSSPLAATNAWTPLVIPYPRSPLCFKQSKAPRPAARHDGYPCPFPLLVCAWMPMTSAIHTTPPAPAGTRLRSH